MSNNLSKNEKKEIKRQLRRMRLIIFGDIGWNIYWKAKREFVEIGEKAVPFLIKEMSSIFGDIRSGAIDILVEINEKIKIPDSYIKIIIPKLKKILLEFLLLTKERNY